MTPDEYVEGFERARRKADELGLDFFVWAGEFYVEDGGKRGRAEDGVWGSAFSSTSSRPATDAECTMWTKLTGLSA